MFLLDCNRNFHQNLYYFGLLSTDCLRISQSRRRRFTTNQFWTLFIEGDTIFKFCLDSVIFPLHTVTFPWFPIKFMRSNHKKQYSKTGSFSNLLPNGSIYSVAPSIQRCRYTLARSFTIGFSLYAECSLFWVTSTTRRTYFLKMFGVFHFGFSHFEVRSKSHQMELQRSLNWVKTHSGKHQLNSYS